MVRTLGLYQTTRLQPLDDGFGMGPNSLNIKVLDTGLAKGIEHCADRGRNCRMSGFEPHGSALQHIAMLGGSDLGRSGGVQCSPDIREDCFQQHAVFGRERSGTLQFFVQPAQRLLQLAHRFTCGRSLSEV